MTEGIFGSQPPKPNQPEKKAIPPQDVQQFIHIQEEINQLEALLTIAQNMVHKQLKEMRQQKAQDIPFHFESLPVEGNGEQRGNIGTYNALQSHLATEIQSLANQVSILKSDAPSFANQLDHMFDQVQEIGKSFPRLSEQQIGSLNSMVTQLNAFANHSGQATQAAFWEEVGAMYQKLFTSNEELIKQYQKQLPQLKGEALMGANITLDHLNANHTRFGAATAGAVAKSSESGSLPNQFQRAILNHYMPNQEKYLMLLAEILMFDNMGAQFGNTLLNVITDFSASATTFDFNNYLAGRATSKKGEYRGSATQARNQLSKETTAAYKDLKALEKALQKIQDEINSIRNNPKLTETQKNKMINQLKSMQKSMKASEKQVKALYNLLKQIKIKPGKDDTHFTVSGPGNWDTLLPEYESIVINGASASQAKKTGLPEGGGLVPISSQVTNFQQTYSDQGQNQQMMLQMRMTEIQQEWTVVSTALQLLNQMYMTVAQGIYK